MLTRLILVLLFLGMIFGGIFYWKQQQQQQAAAQQGPPPPANVAVTEVRGESWQPSLRAIGTLDASQGVNIANEVAGVVREIRFQSGQAVTAGDLLLQLDDNVDKADLRALLAERDLAAIKFRRLSKLVKERSVSQSDYDEAKAELESAEARVASLRAAIEKKAVRAPFDGILGIRSVDLGQYLAPGSVIVSLLSLDPIYVDFALPERHFSRLHTGQRLRLHLTALPDRVFEGQVTAIDPGLDQATRSLRLQATLANPEQLLRPGMFAEVEVLLPERNGVLTVPQTAITSTPYGDSVFLIESKEDQLLVQRRQVETGAVQGEWVEIASGLETGDRIVLAGQVKLRNGQAVQIDNQVLPTGGALGR